MFSKKTRNADNESRLNQQRNKFGKQQKSHFDKREVYISILSLLLGMVAGVMAKVLTGLIGFITNLSFYGKFSIDFVSPRNNHLGMTVILVPIIGALVVGLIARFGSKGIRGHGIPEAMEHVLVNKSRIPPRLTFLKPISAAVSIGTGGPFGAEGPIIATGGALGSLIGQMLPVNADERKILLAAGAAGGMAATFGSPISAILLAIELLLFEFRPRSLLPVALASMSATGIRTIFDGFRPVFAMQVLSPPTGFSLIFYFIIGLVIGLVSVGVAKSVYIIEDLFELLPIHWMWWPALGAVAVGIIGFYVPATLGVGYENIRDILNNNIGGKILFLLFTAKFISWVIALGSGTSGGTLAPLFTVGGGLGAWLGASAALVLPGIGIDPSIAALAGMAALFAGSSRAILTSIVFAFETTQEPNAILPLLTCSCAAYLVSILLLKQTIMTEKIVRRGIRVPHEYGADYLDGLIVKDFATVPAISFNSRERLKQTRERIRNESIRYHTFPVIEGENKVTGIITDKELEDLNENEELELGELISKPLVVLTEDNSIKEAADLMAEFEVNAIPIVDRFDTMKLKGIISRNDILYARKQKIIETKEYVATIRIPGIVNK
jgi:chloride channel protein, CIC family